MADAELVELADRLSRRRAWLAIGAALVFVVVQFVTWPLTFQAGVHGGRADAWAINALVLLGILATGGGIFARRSLWALVHDELAQVHLHRAVRAGYWVAMTLAFVLYFGPWFAGFTGRQAIYVIVAGSVVVALLTFAVLESRAHAEG